MHSALLFLGAQADTMKWVFVYGPPAAGKYTVGRELARLTGYRFFHNHVVNDMVATMFDFNEGPFWKLVSRYREDLLDEAAKHGVSLIMTYVYDPGDLPHLRKYKRAVERHNGRILWVRLYAPVDVLHRRRGSPERRAFKKIRDAKTLNEVLRKYSLFESVPFRPNMSIDTTRVKPREAALLIAKRYRLPIRKS